jgi:outer membrane protein
VFALFIAGLLTRKIIATKETIMQTVLSRFIFLIIICSSPALATDLLEAWRSALSYDPTIAAARATLIAGQEKKPQGLAGLLPQVRIAGHATRNRQALHDKAAPVGSEQQFDNMLGYNLSANQVLYNASAYRQYQQGKKYTLQANVQFIAAQQNLMLRVAQAYFDALLATEHVKQIQAQKEAVTQQMKQAKKSFEVGITTITDYNEAQAKYDEIIAVEIAAQNELLIKQNALLQIAKINPEKLASIDAQFIPTLPDPANVESWLQLAQEKNPEIQEKALAFAIAQDEIEKYRLLKSPTLHLEAGYESRQIRPGAGNGTADLRKDNASIGLILTVPLSTGGYRSSKLRESASLAEQERLQLEAITRQVQHKIRAAFLSVNSGVAQISALRQALKSNQSLVDSTLLGHEVGIRTTEDILNAQQQYYTVKYKLVEAKINYMLSRLSLAANTGVLQEQDLQAINQWLTPHTLH